MADEKFILVDFENIQPANLDRLRDRGFTLRIFLGASQERLPLKIVNSLQVFGTALEYIQTGGIAPNALDFYICFFLGQQSRDTPYAQFFVMSRDTGFDPLLHHLRTQGARCRRVTTSDEIFQEQELTAAVHSLSPLELVHKVVDTLQSRPATRPRTIKTLRSSVNALYGKKLQQTQLDGIVLELKKRGLITEGPQQRLQYHFPPATPETPAQE